MKKWVLLIIVLVVLFISACKPQTSIEPQLPTCNRPYILSGNECCLDVNGNSICDREESEAHVSSEKITASNDISEITCPKEVLFSTSENPNTIVELKIKTKYIGFGSESFRPAFFCDDGYISTINPITLQLEKDIEQTITTKVNLQPRKCTFSLILTSNVDKFVSCEIPVKAV